MPAVVLPVKCAESGAVVNVELVNPYQDDGVAELKRLLASAAGVAVEDQILLIGPPYKPLKRLDPPLVFSSSSARDDEDLTTASAAAASSRSDGAGGGVRGIYLYSRRTLDARAGAGGLDFSKGPSSREEALPVQLPDLPSAPPEAAPAWLASASIAGGGGSGSSRLAESLLSYERLVSLNLARGRAYVERGRRLLEACVRCLEEQRVQRDAGGVALANLLDHFGAIARDYEGLRARHAAQAGRHQALLQNFNPNLRRLDARPLLPALVEALRESLVLQQSQQQQQQQQHASSSSSPGDDGIASGSSPGAAASTGGGSSTSTSSRRHHHHLLGSASAASVPVGLDCAAVEKVLGGSMACTTVTLRDCVPLKRVRDWYEECSQTHERLARWVGEVGESLSQLSKGVELQRGEVRAVDWLAALAMEVEGLKAQLREQEKSAATLEEAHRNALERVRGALLDSSSSSAEGGAGAASGAKQYDTCQWLQGLLDKQAQVMDSLERVDYAMLARARALGEAKVGRTGRWLGQHLVAVSRLQGDIQALRSSLAIGDKLLREERRYFAQLEHLEKLPEAYEALLLEMARRRAYARLFELKVKGALDGVARFREGETAARAEFLRRHAAHLMPVFAQLFPTMQDRPPHFQAMALALDEEQRLPAVTLEDLPGAMQLLVPGRRKGGVEEKEEGVAATLRGYTACLAKGREAGEGEKEEGAGGGGMEIMPGMEAGLSQEELEAKCAAQELAITRLAAQVQSLAASRRELERQLQQQSQQALSLSSLSLSASGGGRGGGKWDSGARGLAEENDSLRSCLGAILSSVEEARRGLALPPSSSAHTAGAAESKAGEASSPQQVVNAVDAAVSDLVKRVRLAEGGFGKGAGVGEGQVVAGPSAGTGAGGGSKPKISFREFHVGDVALFLPTSHQGENRVYLAFHMKCPHHYLSHESLESMRVRHGRFPDYILGTVVYIEELEAGEETDTRSNPYHLKEGTTFKIIHATSVTDADE